MSFQLEIKRRLDELGFQPIRQALGPFHVHELLFRSEYDFRWMHFELVVIRNGFKQYFYIEEDRVTLEFMDEFELHAYLGQSFAELIYNEAPLPIPDNIILGSD